jgi:hypothetical protein
MKPRLLVGTGGEGQIDRFFDRFVNYVSRVIAFVIPEQRSANCREPKSW